MPAKTTLYVIMAFETLYRRRLHGAEIHRELIRQGKKISPTTVKKRIRRIILKDRGIGTPKKRLGKQNLPSKRTKINIRRVDKATSGANPMTYTAMKHKFGLSKTTIGRILYQNLCKQKRRKVRIHALSDAQVAKRLERCPKLHKKISRGKWKYIISTDESWISMNNINRFRKIYWSKKGEKVPQIVKKKFATTHPKKFMFTAGICARGETAMYIVPEKTKVNRWYFIKYVLTPLVKYDIPRLYPGEEKKVVLHFDSATSHTAPVVYKWLKDHHVKFIKKGDWPPNSPDLSPMDYAVNGIIKQKLFARRAVAISGLKRHLTQVWNNFPLSTCYKAMEAWPDRVKQVEKNQGYHIENM